MSWCGFWIAVGLWCLGQCIVDAAKVLTDEGDDT